MQALIDLWLPILLSAVFVFFASSVLHMVINHHKTDCGKLPNEDALLATMREHGVKPGHYGMPHCADMKEMASDEMTAKYNQGPVGFVTVLPNGPFAMGKSLGQWLVFCLIVSAVVAWVSWYAVKPGEGSLKVFKITGAIAILGHALTHVPDSIWKGLSWSVTAKFILDGVIYGVVTAATFAWLWPSA